MTRTAVLVFRVGFFVALAAITWLSLIPQAPQIGPSDKADHATAYYALYLITDFAFPATSIVVKSMSVFAYGVLIEFIQPYTGRFYEVADMAANGVGILLYLASVPLLKRVPIIRRRWEGPRP